MSTPLSHLSQLLGGLHNRHEQFVRQDPLMDQLLDGPDDSETANDPHQARLAAERRASEGQGDGNPLRHDGDGTRGEGPRGDGARNDGARGDHGRGDGVRGDGSRNDGARGDIARGEHHPRGDGPRGEGPRGEGPPRWGHVDGHGQHSRPGQANNAPSPTNTSSTGAPTYQGPGNSLLGSATSVASQLVANTLGAGAANVAQQLANTLGAPLGTAAASAANLADRAAMMAQNALHNAASAPSSLAATNTLPAATTAPLPAAATSPLNPQAALPAAARADAMPAPQRADQSATIQRNASMPASSPPPAAPAAAAVATQATISAVPLAAVPLAVPPSQSPPVDGRPSLTAAGDRGPGQARADLPTLPPGHTAEGTSPRRAVRDRDGLLPIKLSQWLAALGLGLDPKAGRPQDADAEGQGLEGSVALQWLFWALAIVGYGCLAVALVVLLPGGEGFLDETRNPAGTYALIVGLPTSLGAWWLARRMARTQAG
ncbi:hypothetical protein IP90_03152 [Luteimonas cucumeris]|uniref:Uncharacterized protein n=1 Tax=Luteimonas cucumeris TaxID=985012 RepID=A0A562KW31_9GAMM|nr:hypothetical protein [Luteimonas cucumeris]TWH99413.1 hypothetical protein IP90_03152 [Luteimonas cucumeris]